MQRLIPKTRDVVLVGGGHSHELVLRRWGMRELCWHLFTWGPEVTIEAPEGLKSMMSAMIEEALLHQREPQY